MKVRSSATADGGPTSQDPPHTDVDTQPPDGRLYVAWSERTGPSGPPPWADLPDGRIVLTSSADGKTWTEPVLVSPTPFSDPISGRGHQFMPALSVAAGRLMSSMVRGKMIHTLNEPMFTGRSTPITLGSSSPANSPTTGITPTTNGR